MKPLLLTLTLAVAAMATSSCREARCGKAGSNANISGDWALTGSTSGPECRPRGTERSQTQLATPTRLPIQQSPNVSGAEELFITANLAGDAGTFELTGTVEGSCVDFATEENIGGVVTRWSFSGVVNGRSIDGRVSGTSLGCSVSGPFHVSVLGGNADSGFVGTPIENRDGGFHSVRIDAGACDAGAPADAGDLDDGGAFDAGPQICGSQVVRVFDHFYHCRSTRDCPRGVCSKDGICISACETSLDCTVGNACAQSVCESAPGCGCSSSGSVGAMAVIALLLRRRAFSRSRGRPRSADAL